MDHRPGRRRRPVPRARRLGRATRRRSSVLRTDLAAPARGRALRAAARRARGRHGTACAGGRPAPPGTYQLVALVRDQAGNVGRSAPPDRGAGAVRGQPGVSVRGAARPAARGSRARRRARSSSPSTPAAGRSAGASHRVGERKPRAHEARATAGGAGELKVRAPQRLLGRVRARVRTGKALTAVPFAVQDAATAPILVVLPAVTWFGHDPLDDDRDGVPNTLERGGPADYPRLLAGGLPDRFSDEIAPLLAFLDGQNVRYDVTTDLTLAATRVGAHRRAPGGAARRAAALDPDVELARRLRALRHRRRPRRRRSAPTRCAAASTSPATGCCARSPPTDADPFGAALRPLRRLGAARSRSSRSPTRAETACSPASSSCRASPSWRSRAVDDRVRVALAAVDRAGRSRRRRRPARSPPSRPGARRSPTLGEGIVIRVGLPEWGARLKQAAPCPSSS